MWLLADAIQFNTRHKLRRKEVDDVLGGEETWKNVDQTDGVYGC